MSYPPKAAPYGALPGSEQPYPGYPPSAGPTGGYPPPAGSEAYPPPYATQQQIGFQPGFIGGPNQQQQVIQYISISNQETFTNVHYLFST